MQIIKAAYSRCWWLLLLGVALGTQGAGRFTGPWNLKALQAPPKATWGNRSNLVQEVWYEGEPFKGRPTRVFAYYARPVGGQPPFPAMVLVHGGGGKAFPDWAAYWAQRGYAALAMDTAGQGPQGKLPDGGPDQSDDAKFGDFDSNEVTDMWTYHAVAAIIRGHSLLAAQPEVDRHRVGITGISWGGYLTCIVAGLDNRLKVAVPVYGCGFIHVNSCWVKPWFSRMSNAQFRRWTKYFEPSQYLPGVRCPILFLNGSNDFAYPLDSYRKSYESVPGHKTLSVIINLPHGHIWTFKEVDCFVDSVLLKGPPLPRISPLRRTGDRAFAKAYSPTALAKAQLHYTTDAGDWQKRAWKSVPAELANGKVTAALPGDLPLVYFVSVTDSRGLTVSTPHEELPGSTSLHSLTR